MKTSLAHKALIALSGAVLFAPLTLSASTDDTGSNDNGGQACDGQMKKYEGRNGVGEGRGVDEFDAMMDAIDHAYMQANNGTIWCNLCPDGEMCNATRDVTIHWTGQEFWGYDDQFDHVLVDLPFDGWTVEQTCAQCD